MHARAGTRPHQRFAAHTTDEPTLKQAEEDRETENSAVAMQRLRELEEREAAQIEMRRALQMEMERERGVERGLLQEELRKRKDEIGPLILVD